MTANVPAPRDEAPLVAEALELHPDHRDPHHQQVQQNLRVALLPLALIAFVVLVFVAAAWTFLAAS